MSQLVSLFKSWLALLNVANPGFPPLYHFFMPTTCCFLTYFESRDQYDIRDLPNMVNYKSAH